MLLARLFLFAVAALYVGLGVWCTVAPDTTSKKVGLERVGEGGRSEFITVYGGLEVGLGLLFAFLAWRPESVVYGLTACAVIHGAIVVFRSGSFVFHDAMHGMVLRLAIGEWVLTLLSLTLLVMLRGK